MPDVPAADLLAAEDASLIPWLPLTRFDGEPKRLLRQCRERIVQQADLKERANLLAVTQVFSRLRFPSPRLLEILGGKNIMAESRLCNAFAKRPLNALQLYQIRCARTKGRMAGAS